MCLYAARTKNDAERQIPFLRLGAIFWVYGQVYDQAPSIIPNHCAQNTIAPKILSN